MQLPAGSQGKPDPSGFPGQCKRPGSGGRRRTGLRLHHCGGRRTPGNPFSGALQRGDGQGRHSGPVSLYLCSRSLRGRGCVRPVRHMAQRHEAGRRGCQKHVRHPHSLRGHICHEEHHELLRPAGPLHWRHQPPGQPHSGHNRGGQPKLQKGPGGGRRTEKHTDGGKYIRQRYLPVSDKKPDKTTVRRPEHLQAVICRLLWI